MELDGFLVQDLELEADFTSFQGDCPSSIHARPSALSSVEKVGHGADDGDEGPRPQRKAPALSAKST